MSRGWTTTFLCLAALLVVVGADDPKHAAPNDAADLTSDHAEGKKETTAVLLTKWLDSVPGGFFNSKQETRPVSPGSSHFGIFAKEDIAKGDLLAKIPWEYIINDEESDPSLSEEDFDGAVLRCGTVRNLAREMKQVQTLSKYIKDPNSASKYGPYIQYLLEMPRGQIPSDWSVKGRAIFEGIVGEAPQNLPPSFATSWIEDDFLEECNGDPKDEMGKKAATLVIARGDDDLLVPVYDMYNHRNGIWYNTHMQVNRGVNYQVTARRDIKAGEQIYNSYNMCDNCGGRKDGYGTPECFRDYGFVEEYPQRWNFEEQEFMFDISELENGEMEVVWSKGDIEDEDERDGLKRMILKTLQRLAKKKATIWKEEFKDGKISIPENEWNGIWAYHQAMLSALMYAYNDIAEESEKLPAEDSSCSADGFCGIDYFDELKYEKDEVKYNIQTCENKEIMKFPGYFMMEGLKTHYQVLNFAFREEDGDICMDLEDTVQICSCYRPHYHEFSSHFAARFVDNVKRVVFVGGGDSMMLHEVLKYPALEKVVGLELDQTVVRKSFKYFKTQPHFDNDKVEWWFGDATKSLLLLPEDYWGSFDLVIVDLSETVMAFSVTDKLDVFGALALLLNPDGVMVKNEHYMQTMSETFDYTLQVYLDQNPKICSQCMIFGSNKADFFHKPLVEHGVETLLLPPVDKLKDEFEYFHDISKNDAMKQGKCDLDTNKDKNETKQTKSAGLLHILDAEGVGVDLDKESVESVILEAAKEEGWTKIEPSDDSKLNTVLFKAEPAESESTFVHFVFKEGYAAARIYPKSKYVSMDVGVWSSFQKGDNLRNRIANDLKAKTSSFFRVVVGGMFGTPTWEEEKDTIGPQIVQQRNCEKSDKTETEFTDNLAKKTVLDEALNLLSGSGNVAAVFCGVEGVDTCSSLDVLGQHMAVGKVIPVWACRDLPESAADESRSESFSKKVSCEQNVLSALMEGRHGAGSGIRLIVIDEKAPLLMGSVLHSILSVDGEHRDMLMERDNQFVVSVSTKPSSEEWRENMLERYRKVVLFDPVKLAKYEITVDGAQMELALVSVSEEVGFKRLKTLENKLATRLSSRKGAEVSVEVTKITGGLFKHQHNYNPREYLQTDYPEEPGIKQWGEQKSVGRKTVVQYEVNTEHGNSAMPDLQGFVRLVDTTLTGYGGVFEHRVYTDVGDGIVIVTENKMGSLILTWDGRDHCDLNIFLHDDTEWEMKEYLSEFNRISSSKLKMTLRDDFPRGTGRVMNFNKDMEYTGWKDIWDPDPYVEQD